MILPAAFVVVVVVVLLTFFALPSQAFDQGDEMDANANFTPQQRVLAVAISHAEGYGLANAIPTEANNPGDLVLPGWQGQSLGSEKISVLTSDTPDNPVPPNGGWFRLYRQIRLIDQGNSTVYNISMTISEMAKKWTATDPEAWARNVSSFLGVTPDTLLETVLRG